ncbi:MAG: EamA family transporter [Ilumatobacteraceae bacterium]
MAGDLPHRSRTLRLNSTPTSSSSRRALGTFLATAPPEALFLISATAQYLGAVIAVDLFDEIDPASVAWLRVIGASVALMIVAGPRLKQAYTRRDLAAMAVFGIATAAMNMFFYLAIDRLPLGKGVAIEFIGPIAVAAVRTRTRRNALALMLAAIGVAVLSGIELGDEPLGLLYIFLASAMWAAYIVVGSRVAQQDRGVAGLGLGLLLGALVITPVGAPGSGPAWESLRILILCVLVGLLSSAIGYGIDQSVLRRVPVRRFSVMLALLPVTATVIGFIALDQTPSVIDLIGMALVLTGVIVQDRDNLPSRDQ